MALKKNTDYIFAVGRRKTATARVHLFPAKADVQIGDQKLAKGEIYVNGLPIEKYFPTSLDKFSYTEIFRSTNTIGRFIATVKVEGSGKSGQLGALVLALSRALSIADPKHKEILARKGLLKRDPRAKERKKPGLMGARKQKSSPKR
jgi:small subunit ribosomal protein S9